MEIARRLSPFSTLLFLFPLLHSSAMSNSPPTDNDLKEPRTVESKQNNESSIDPVNEGAKDSIGDGVGISPDEDRMEAKRRMVAKLLKITLGRDVALDVQFLFDFGGGFAQSPR